MKKLFLILALTLLLVAGCGGGGGGGTTNKGINIAQYIPGGEVMGGMSIKAVTTRGKYYFTAPFTEFGFFAFCPIDGEGNMITPEETAVEWALENNNLGTLILPYTGEENARIFTGLTDGQTTVTATRLDTGESATAQIVVFPALQLDYNQQGIGRGIVLSEKRQTYLEREADIWLAADRKSIVIPGGYVKSSDWEMGLEWLENPTLDASQIGTDTVLTSDIYYQNPYLIRDKNGDVWAIYGSRRGFAFNKISE